jgi:hypothetical protein
MDFRWAVGIALWTMLMGPVIGPPLPRPTVQPSMEVTEPEASAPGQDITPY